MNADRDILATVDFSSLRICVTMSVREYECVPCVRDRVNKCTPTDNTQCDSRHARTARTTHARTHAHGHANSK